MIAKICCLVIENVFVTSRYAVFQHESSLKLWLSSAVMNINMHDHFRCNIYTLVNVYVDLVVVRVLSVLYRPEKVDNGVNTI